MRTSGFSKVSKQNIIKQIKQDLDGKELVLLTQHDAVAASAIDKLRSNLRKNNAKYVSVKKSLARVALKSTHLEKLNDYAKGSCGLVIGQQDPVAPSKTLVDFAKANEKFLIHAGIMNGELIEFAQIKDLASLPSREVLLAKVLGGMQAPISQFVGVLSNTMRGLVTALDAIAKKKGSENNG